MGYALCLAAGFLAGFFLCAALYVGGKDDEVMERIERKKK